MRVSTLYTPALASFAFIVGFFADIGKDVLYDHVAPPTQVSVEIVDIQMGYVPIDLEIWDLQLNVREISELSDRFAPDDSIFLSRSFVSEFNAIGAKSSTIGQFISKRYNGEEFFEVIQNPLGLYEILVCTKVFRRIGHAN